MNEAGSSKWFFATEFFREKYNYVDNRKGANYHYLAYMVEGRCKIVSADVTIEAEAGQAFYIPMGLPYESYWYGTKIRFHSYGFRYFPEAEGKSFRLQVLPQELAQTVRDIPIRQPMDTEVLHQMFAALQKVQPHLHIQKFCSTHRAYDEARKYLYDHPDSSISDVAKHCSVSESALYAIFKKMGAKTPNDVRQEILVQKAVHLLTTTDRSVQEISELLGFSSASYFRKILHKHTGKTPREIRKATFAI